MRGGSGSLTAPSSRGTLRSISRTLSNMADSCPYNSGEAPLPGVCVMNRRLLVLALLLALLPGGRAAAADAPVKRYLYVVAPGIRSYLQFGGAGILVFDIDKGHAFVKRIATTASLEAKPANIKGVCACPAT